MSDPNSKISREELHQMVWTRPFVKLANELGYSYNELVAICASLNIPRPTGGYWYRQTHGGAGDPIPLPPPTSRGTYEIPFGPRYGRTDEPIASDPPQRNAAASGTQSLPTPEDDAREKTTAAKVQLPAKVEYTREQLYEAVWTKPGLKLAADLGLSDVGLAKTCRRMGIPRPQRGYGACIAVGKRIKRSPLPGIKAGQGDVVTFHVAANLERREVSVLNIVPSAMAGVRCPKVELPSPDAELHPVALRHLVALEKAKPEQLGFVTAKGKNFFRCEMSNAMVPLFARAADALLCELEDRDYDFKQGSDEYAGLRITRDTHDITLHWSEAKLEIERVPTLEEKRKPSWTWQLKEVRPAGKLSIEISAMGLKGKRKWTSGEGRTLEEVLGVVVEKIEAIFRGFETQRQREIELAKQREEAAKRRAEDAAREVERQAKVQKERKEQERLQRHQKKIEAIATERRNNLCAAARDWMETRRVEDFLKACEERWRNVASGDLSAKQQEWLVWARQELEKLGPFVQGYPDPALDGSFPAGELPIGGPYPETREWPKREKEKGETKSASPEQSCSTSQPTSYPGGWKY